MNEVWLSTIAKKEAKTILEIKYIYILLLSLDR